MWDGMVSMLNSVGNVAVAQGITVFAQHPLVATGVLLASLVLLAILCVELVKADRPAEEVERPILIRR